MTDLAKLSMSVDATGMAAGDQALDRITQKAEHAENKVIRATAGMAKGMGQVRGEASRLGPAIQNASYQVGDFAVQVAGGQSAAMAFAQQFPQLAGGMGVWGAAIGAVVAVGAALTPVLFNVGGGAKSAKDAVEGLSEALEAYQRYAVIASSKTGDLMEKFGAFAGSIREMSRYMSEVSISVMVEGLEDAIEPIKGQLSTVQDSVKMLADYKQMLASMGISEAVGGPMWNEASISIKSYEDAIRRSAEAMGLLPDQAEKLAAMLDHIKTASGPEEIAARAAEAFEYMQGIEQSGLALPAPLREVAQSLADIAASASSAAKDGETLATVNMADNINNAGFAASFLATEMGKALANAQMLGGFAPDLDRFKPNLGLSYGQTTGDGSWYDGQTAAGLLPSQRFGGLRKPPAPKGGSRRGGGGRERENEFERSTIEIMAQTKAFLAQADAMAKIATAGGDWEHAIAVIEEKQNLLNAAQKAGVALTPEVIAQIDALAEGYVSAEEKLDRLRQSTERGRDAFKDLFGAALEGADAFKDALGNLFAEMAKVQFQKGMLGLLGQTSWGGGLISAVGGLLSPFGGGRATGGLVDAGTTYLVGEKGPELITMAGNGHVTPNHMLASGSRSGQQDVNVHITVGVDKETGNLTEFVDQRAISVARTTTSAGLRAYDRQLPDRFKQIQTKPRTR